jgi:heparosan-N-sulfate-glucuronate 5-epimerase
MNLASRFKYYRRIFPAYLGRRTSHLTFWHDSPEINHRFASRSLGEYYMPFLEKADYSGPHDPQGVPLLDYRGSLGRQYNPIAIAQFGLGNYNLFCRTGQEQRRRKFLLVADWLVANLETNRAGLRVWNHHFDWEYRTTLRAPWQSALAQSQGISVLVRAFDETGDGMYLEAAALAFEALQVETSGGGMVHVDERGDPWLEEYIVSPPTHILNGFMWAIWGVYDYWLATGRQAARKLFAATVTTLKRNLEKYDAGFWSLYELAGTRLKMLASHFYHHLHITQLGVLHKLTADDLFARYAEKWAAYRRSLVKRNAALAYKSAFKLLYY